MNEARLEADLTLAEKEVLRSYKDSRGIWTAGKGRNLEAMVITKHVSDEWFKEDIFTAYTEAKKFTAWKFLDTDARQNAFVEMIFQMGAYRVGGFHDMLSAICVQDWQTAHDEALDSDWHRRDSPKRAERVAEMLRTGLFPA